MKFPNDPTPQMLSAGMQALAAHAGINEIEDIVPSADLSRERLLWAWRAMVRQHQADVEHKKERG